MSTRAEALCGTSAAWPQPLRFSTGPLAFELVCGNVHAVRICGVEILRAIQYLIRDGDWGTLRPAIADLEVVQDAIGVTVTYTATVRDTDGAALTYAATITATDATLDFTVEARADSDFDRTSVV